jgi:biotin transport system substrate-specific component
MYRLLLVVFFTSLMAFSSFAAIKVPFLWWGKPTTLPGAEVLHEWNNLSFGSHVITAQIPAVWLAGVLLGPRLGCLSVVLYLALGLSGVPVFTNGGGFSYVHEPTFGYLIGFVPAVILVGITSRDHRFGPTWSGLIGALVLIQGIGFLYELAVRNQFFSLESWVQLGFSQVIQFLPGYLALLTVLAFFIGLAGQAHRAIAARTQARRGQEPILPPHDNSG